MILAFGDLHADKSQIRILTVINFLDYIINYCKEHKEITTVVNLGDTFHTSNSIRNECFVPIFMKFLELSKIVKVITIVGNHDALNKDNTDTLSETFSAFSTFIKKSESINIDGMDYDFLSYTEDPSDIPNKSRVLFGHLEVEGFFFNPNRKIDSSMFTPEMFDQYNIVISGHLHHSQLRDNFCFVGSPYPTNRGEGGKKNYFALIDGDRVELKEYNEGPDYITISAEQFNDKIDYTNKIVTVQINQKIENFVKLRDILYERGAIEINPEFIKDDIEETQEEKIDTNENVIKSAAKYISEIKNSKINNEKLLNCYKNILGRIK